MNIECIKSRKLILESSDIELLTPELEEAKLHLKGCKECQLFFTQQEELRKLIKENLPVEKTPASVREKIYESISIKKNKRARLSFIGDKKLLIYSFAAAVIIITIVSLLILNPYETKPPVTIISKSGEQLTDELINDYIRYRMSEQPAEYVTNNSLELNSWFSGRLDFNARFPAIDDLQLVGGRLCYLFDRRVALAFYQKPHQWVSIFIFKDDHIDLSKMKTEKLKNKNVWHSSRNGYELAVWQRNDLLYALVADADCMELAEKLNTGMIE